MVDEGRSDEGCPSIRSIPSFLCLPQPLSPQPPLHTYRIFPLAVTRISNLRQDNHLESETFSPQNLPICAAMDPSDDVPPPPKKQCSDDRKATYTNNFAKRHRRKGRGRSRDTSLSRHTRGSKMKKSSYDFVGVGESLGTGPDPQSIKSKLLPDNVLPQRKPTLKEYKAEIKSKDKRIDQLSKRLMKTEQKYQRHHNMFETKLKMKEESVQKLNRMLARKKEQVTDLSNKLR